MSWPNVINGSFEALGGAFILLSVRKLSQEKIVRGFHWGHLAFFTGWGLWNLYYSPQLGQWWSFVGGVGVAVVNLIYLVQIIYYTRRGAK